MIGITLTTDQIRNAPPQVRQWIEHEVIASLGLAADAPPAAEHGQGAHLVGCSPEEAAAVLTEIHGMIPAFNVFFEFARPGISFGQPPAMAFRLIDILYHTRLQSIDQVMECLEAINTGLCPPPPRSRGAVLRLRHPGPLPDRARNPAQRRGAVAADSRQPTGVRIRQASGRHAGAEPGHGRLKRPCAAEFGPFGIDN